MNVTCITRHLTFSAKPSIADWIKAQSLTPLTIDKSLVLGERMLGFGLGLSYFATFLFVTW